MSFITELKRRNVFKVASVYLLTTWLILQIIAVISPTLNLPLMFGTITTVILFLGFPIACIIAWAFELTPEGMKFTKDVNKEDSIRHETGQKLNSSLMAVIVLLLGFILYDKFFNFPKNETEEVSIAVLPFQDMSPDNSQEYFGDGIAEEILNSLARLNKMLVISRTSSFKFKETKEDIREIGKLLNVNYVLEGSVRKDKDTFRITAQLIEVSSGTHLWSQTYDKKLNSIFAMQDELTYAITQALKLNLLPNEVKAEAGMTTNHQAYDLFLKGRDISYQRNNKAINESRSLLEQAISLDSQFNMAKAQLFMTLYLGEHYGVYIAENVEPKLINLFEELIASNEDFALKSLIKAIYLGELNNKSVLAQPLYQLARQQAPSDSMINNYSLNGLVKTESVSKIINYREQYALINPLDEVNLANLFHYNWAVGNHEQAMTSLNKLVEQSPEHSLAAEEQTSYLLSSSPVDVAPYLAAFKGEMNQRTQENLIQSLIITGELQQAITELANLSMNNPLLLSDELLTHLWIALSEHGENNALITSYRQLNIDVEKHKRISLYEKYTLGDMQGILTAFDNKIFTNKELFIKELETANIPVFDAGQVLVEYSSRHKGAYLKTDTHWLPGAMEKVAENLAEYVKTHFDISDGSTRYQVQAMDVASTGDITKMLTLPENNDLFPEQKVKIRQILTEQDEYWQPSPESELLVLGDSFANIYSFKGLNWGFAAGLAEHLSLRLRQPVDLIARNDSGAYVTREMLAMEMQRGRDRLAGKKLVIWEFSEREFSSGDWKKIELQLNTSLEESEFFVLNKGEKLEVTGTVSSISVSPRPGTVPYTDNIVTLHLVDLCAASGEELDLQQGIVYGWGMRDNQLTDLAMVRPGDSLGFTLTSWDDVEGEYGGFRRTTLADEMMELELPNWGDVISE